MTIGASAPSLGGRPFPESGMTFSSAVLSALHSPATLPRPQFGRGFLRMGHDRDERSGEGWRQCRADAAG